MVFGELVVDSTRQLQDADEVLRNSLAMRSQMVHKQDRCGPRDNDGLDAAGRTKHKVAKTVTDWNSARPQATHDSRGPSVHHQRYKWYRYRWTNFRQLLGGPEVHLCVYTCTRIAKT